MIVYSEAQNADGNLLTKFLIQHATSASKLGVLLFWSRHPQTKFTVDGIDLALETRKQDLREGLEALVEEGVVSKERTTTGVTLYSLTTEPQKREPVLELAKQEHGPRGTSIRQLVSQPLTGFAQ
ncbi:MAG: hypothetical protein HW414_389 [Dehalococcoidia bacterium]|nr:hypothetical protein [Dehalococcoidia bacterium]